MKESIEKLIQEYKNELNDPFFQDRTYINFYDLGRVEEIETIIEKLEAILETTV